MDILKLKETRAAKIAALTAVLDKAIAENRSALNEDEQKEHDALNAEIESLKGMIDAAERAAALEAETRSAATPAPRIPVAEVRAEDAQKKEYRSNLRNYLVNGEARSLTTGATPGSYLVSDTLFDKIVMGYGVHGGVRATKAKKLTTANGNDFLINVNTDTAKATRLNAGNAAPADPGLTQKNLATYEYKTPIVKVSPSLLKDSAVDVEQYLADLFAEQMVKGVNVDLTLGTGSSQPEGFLTAATLGVTAASTSAVTVAELRGLMFSVKAPVRANGEWTMNDATLKVVAGLLEDSRPIYDAEKNLLLGKPVVINDDMPDLAAGAKAIAFGDFSQYTVRDVTGDMFVQRLNEKYAEEGMIGFMLIARHGGVLANAGTCIKFIQQAAA